MSDSPRSPQATVFVVTRWREFETGAVYGTREAAERALADLLEADRLHWERSTWQVTSGPWEPPLTDIIEVPIQA